MKMNIHIIIFLIISNLFLIHCEGEREENANIPKQVENILIFNHAKLNGGSNNRNGDLIIEYYSEENYFDMPNSILFYGLSKNGGYCFPNESSNTQEQNIDIDEIIDIAGYYNTYETYDSKNLFVSLKNDSNREDQYLFSINSYNSIVELHNFNNNAAKNHYIWDFNDFFQLEEDDYIFQYERELFELRGASQFIIAFIPNSVVGGDLNELSFIKKFSLKSFDDNAYEEIKSIDFSKYANKAILGIFFMDDCGILVTISYKLPSKPPNKDIKLDINLFNQNLKSLDPETKLTILFNCWLVPTTESKYFKSVYLKKNYVVIAFIGFFNGLYNINFDLCYISLSLPGYRINPKKYDPYKYTILYINPNGFLSDFIKINDFKLIFIYKAYCPYGRRNLHVCENKLIIKIIKINLDYTDYSISEKKFDLEDYIPIMRISGFIHNGFLLCTSTAILRKEIGNDDNYFSMLMIFGYPNGTDSTVDISDFIFVNEESDANPSSFYEFLIKNYTIENNIFGYKSVNMIKLVSIPEEIIILEAIEANGNSETNELKNNSFMHRDYNYIVKQNTNLIKTSNYYIIDYQYMVKQSEDKEPIYGRTNRLKFKLCYDFCETCKELGTSDNDQKCLSCLPEYQYDYFYFTQKNNNNELLTCVPEKYYNNGNNLTQCDDENTKHYFNLTNNKTICFDSYYDCPLSYPVYNETTKECFYCDFERFNKGECNFNKFNTTNKDFYERIIADGYISNYDGSGDLKVNNANGYAFQITTLKNELNTLKDHSQRNFSIIDFNDCAELLKRQYGLSSNDDLIILKYENYNQASNGKEKSIQYEVYLRHNNTKLNLSICANSEINIYIPVELNEDTQNLYDSLKEQGYNIFDKNDKFYHDICTPYKSVDGTDVILLDRVNDIYESNMFKCQEHCKYSEYIPETKYIKCDCNITNEEKIDTKEPEKITAKSLSNTFYNELKYSNYKVLRCYNLVFRKVTIQENAGSILSNIYFIGYLISFGIFCYTKAAYLKNEIDKLIGGDANEKNNSNELNLENISIYHKNIVFDKNNLEEKGNNENNDTINEANQGNKDAEVIKVKKKKNESNSIIKNSKQNNDIGKKDSVKHFNNFIKGEKNKGKKNVNNKIYENLSEQKKLDSKDGLVKNLFIPEEKQSNDISKKQSDKGSNKSEKESKKSEKDGLTDYELNDLEYEEALELDNRNFLNIYWYLLKREHIIIFTFFSNNDYNLFSIKLSKLFVAICSDMAFNVFFFSDASMHEIYASGGGHGWTSQFAQMVYSTMISQILQIFLNYLTMTDIPYYQLKELKKDNNLNSEKALSIIKCIKYKIIAYFSSTFILFLFFWYTASAFCAVYKNTQGIYIADSYTSFIMGLTYPFALYLAPAGLRYLSLKAKDKKNLKILYSLSDKIPIF